jgi:hypothetical protein
MEKIINFGIMSRPENWLIIWLVLFLSAQLARIVFDATQGVSIVKSLTN